MGTIKHEQMKEQQLFSSDRPIVLSTKSEQTVQRTPIGSSLYQRAQSDSRSLSSPEMQFLQRTLGNRAVAQLFQRTASSSSVTATPPLSSTPPLTRSAISIKGKSVEENNTGLPDTLKAGVENLSGLSLDDVHVHYHSSQPASVQALAYTQGTDIHVGPGQEKHLPHEAWHVVQQKQGRVTPTLQAKGVAINDDAGLEREADAMGARATSSQQDAAPEQHIAQATSGADVVQCYFEQERFSSTWLQADDMTIAVETGYPNHELYAKPGKARNATTELEVVHSGVELIETSQGKIFWEGPSRKRQQTLVKIEARNKENSTQGDSMRLYADCGKSNAVVVGSTDERRLAVYDEPGGAANAKVPGTPQDMKVAIIKAWMKHRRTALRPLEALRITLALNKAQWKEWGLTALVDESSKATTDTEREEIGTRYSKKLDEIADLYWDYYNKLPAAKRDKIDKALKINRYANPNVGQGYTISTGGPPIDPAKTWNFHWGGVVMVSDDNKDKVVLENYAVEDPTKENTDWTFDMYGTKKPGQTFHERHTDTGQHGQTPTTMTIEKEP